MPNNHQQPTVYLQSGSPATENRPPDGYSGGQMGDRFTVETPGDLKARGYQLVKNDSIMDVEPTAGAVAWWKNPPDAAEPYVVTTDVSAAGRGNVAGVYPNASDLGNVTCIQQQGPAVVQLGSGTPDATGLMVIPGSSDAKADVLAAAGPLTYPAMGKSTSVSSGSPTTFEAELNMEGRA